MTSASNPLIIIGTVILTPLLTGFILTYRNLRKEKERYLYLSNFQILFMKWCDSDCVDNSVYAEIIKLSPKAHTLLGEFATMKFRPPSEDTFMNKWAVIHNAIPQINKNKKLLQSLDGNRILEIEIKNYIDLVNESLLRALGRSNDIQSEIKIKLRSPFLLLFQGLNFILTTPALLLAECGLYQRCAALTHWRIPLKVKF